VRSDWAAGDAGGVNEGASAQDDDDVVVSKGDAGSRAG
jgi:hypothetical protein